MTDCVSFENANRLQPLRSAGSVFELPQNFRASPEAWLSWSEQTRLGHLRSFYPRRPGETPAQYDSRLSLLSTQVTTKAFASGARFPRALRPAGSGSATDLTKDFTADSSSSSSGNTTALINAASSILGTGATALTAAIQQGNETERARIAAQTQVKLAELQAQQRLTTDPAAQAANQSMQETLQALLARLGGASQGLSTNAIIALAAAGVVVVGGIVYFMTRPSHGPRHNPVMIDANGRRKFVPAWKVRHNPSPWTAYRHGSRYIVMSPENQIRGTLTPAEFLVAKRDGSVNAGGLLIDQAWYHDDLRRRLSGGSRRNPSGFRQDVYQAYPIDKATGEIDTYSSNGEYDFRKWSAADVLERRRGDSLEETRELGGGYYVIRNGRRVEFLWRLPSDHRARIHYR